MLGPEEKFFQARPLRISGSYCYFLKMNPQPRGAIALSPPHRARPFQSRSGPEGDPHLRASVALESDSGSILPVILRAPVILRKRIPTATPGAHPLAVLAQVMRRASDATLSLCGSPAIVITGERSQASGAHDLPNENRMLANE